MGTGPKLQDGSAAQKVTKCGFGDSKPPDTLRYRLSPTPPHTGPRFLSHNTLPFSRLHQRVPTSPPGGLSADFHSGPAERGKDGGVAGARPPQLCVRVHRPAAPSRPLASPGTSSRPTFWLESESVLQSSIEPLKVLGSPSVEKGKDRLSSRPQGLAPPSHPPPWPQPRHSLAVTPGLVLPPPSGSTGKAGSRGVRSSSTPGPTRRSFRPSTTGKGGGKPRSHKEPCRERQGAFHPSHA